MYMPFVEICDDIREECEKYGKLIDMKVPRPTGGKTTNAGVGKIYVRFENHSVAAMALRGLAGRKFADRTVVVSYFLEVRQYYSILFEYKQTVFQSC